MTTSSRLLLLSLLSAGSLAAQALPTARPDEVGFSPARLERVGAVLREYSGNHRIAGATAIVLRRGKMVLHDSAGFADLEAGRVMRPDAIFRIASMTKAITSVAVMILVEEGKLRLTDPVSKFIPAYAKTTVSRDSTVDGVRTAVVVPARRAITIRDLLTHTAGISYGTEPRLDSLYQAAGVHLWYFADKAEGICTTMERLATLPFAAQPGEAFVYGFNTDILGCVVERVSGMPFDQFVQLRILDPLKMKDTHFYLPPAKAARLAAVYGAGEDGTVRRAPGAGRVGQGEYVTGPRRSMSGGAGLLSTALDYARFLQMLLNGGELEGADILSPKTVELMTVNHAGTLFNGGRQGFGLGFAITEELGQTPDYGSPGAYGWGGAYFTTYWVDPKEQLVAVMMAQLLPANGLDLQEKFRTLVYQGILETYR
jgi:CubicO group peptidase (beta-lactamase class C family)